MKRKKSRKYKLPFLDWFFVNGRFLSDIEQDRKIGAKIDQNLMDANIELRKRLSRYE